MFPPPPRIYIYLVRRCAMDRLTSAGPLFSAVTLLCSGVVYHTAVVPGRYDIPEVQQSYTRSAMQRVGHVRMSCAYSPLPAFVCPLCQTWSLPATIGDDAGRVLLQLFVAAAAVASYLLHKFRTECSHCIRGTELPGSMYAGTDVLTTY